MLGGFDTLGAQESVTVILTIKEDFEMNPRRLLIGQYLLVALMFVTASVTPLMISGCGSAEEMEEDPLFSQTARLQYRVDSLMAENRRLIQQVDALASDNRSLTARAAELEMRLREAQTAPPPPPPIADVSSAYSAALSQYRRQDFSGAMLQFEQLLSTGIRDDLADNCHYWIGECLYGLKKYSDAIHHFETAMAFSHSEKKDDSLLMIGNSYAAMGNKNSAKEAYNRLVSSYPASPYVKKAQEKLAKLG